MLYTVQTWPLVPKPAASLYNNCHIGQAKSSLGRKTPAVLQSQPEALMCSGAATLLLVGRALFLGARLLVSSRVQPVRNRCDAAVRCASCPIYRSQTAVSACCAPGPLFLGNFCFM